MNFIDYSMDKNLNKGEGNFRERLIIRIVKSLCYLFNSVFKLKGILVDFIVLVLMEVDGIFLKFLFFKILLINVVFLRMEFKIGVLGNKLDFILSERNESGNYDSELIVVEENEYEDMFGFRDL